MLRCMGSSCATGHRPPDDAPPFARPHRLFDAGRSPRPCRHGRARFYLFSPLFAWALFMAPAARSEAQEVPGQLEQPAPSQGGSLERDTVPAAGEHDILLSIDRFGRYAIRASSVQGVALALVDAAAGPGVAAGVPGHQDGRLDTFLDKGTYKLRVTGLDGQAGEVRLEVLPFVELHEGRDVRLQDGDRISDTLADLQQRTYRLWVEAPTDVIVEAAGRALADMAVWETGGWRLGTQVTCAIVTPEEGRPLRSCLFAARLDRGWYTVTVDGGPPLPWTDGSAATPLYVRAGIPDTGTCYRHEHRIGPFGSDRFLASGDATYFGLTLPEPADASIRVVPYSLGVLTGGGTKRHITTKSSIPAASLRVAGMPSGRYLVVVEGEPGQRYRLDHFLAVDRTVRLEGRGDCWLSGVSTGYPEDELDATAVLTVAPGSRGAARLIAIQGVVLDETSTWSRRFNLTAKSTLFLDVRAGGDYRILNRGVDAYFRVEPFFFQRPRGYREPLMQQGSSTWSLNPGPYVLTMVPIERGIAQVTLAGPGAPVGGAESPGEPPGDAAPMGGILFPNIRLNPGLHYLLILGERPGLDVGLDMRPLPVDLGHPLVFMPPGGNDLSIPVEVPEAGAIVAETEDGRPVDLSVEGAGPDPRLEVSAGVTTIRVEHLDPRSRAYTIRFEPRAPAGEGDESTAPVSEGQTSGAWPVLSDESPVYLDLDTGGRATFRLEVEEPGLYRLETTGLLETEGALRTRTNPTLATARSNGVGRNFLIQHPLRPGDYLLTVRAVGRSRGHLGVALSRAPILESGEITPGTPLRVHLPAGTAAVYRMTIDHDQEVRIHAFGRSTGYATRLEDEGGWPLHAGELASGSTVRLRPGSYRLVLLPGATDSRRLVLVEPLAVPKSMRGHGPHVLPVATRIHHLWTEEPGNGSRPPDVWTFDLAAETETEIELTGDMVGTLSWRGAGNEAAKVAEIGPPGVWRGLLSAGSYRLEAVNRRRDNRVPYTIAVWPRCLVPGLSIQVDAPASVPISIGDADLVRLSTFGADDVRVRLRDVSTREVAANDDRPGGWNAYLLERLEPGRYTLEVDPVGSDAGRTRVSLDAVTVRESGPLVPPGTRELGIGEDAVVVPIEIQRPADFLVAALETREVVGCALETLRGGVWRRVGASMGRSPHIEMRLDGRLAERAPPYRMMVWSLGGPDAITLQVETATRTAKSARQLEAGTVAAPVSETLAGVAAMRVATGRPGLFRLTAGASSIRWCPAPGMACVVPDGGLVSSSDGILGLTGDLPEPGVPARVQAERLVLGSPETPEVRARAVSGTRVACDVAAREAQWVAVTATPSRGMAGVAVAGSAEAFPSDLSTSMAVGMKSTLAVGFTMTGDPLAWLWPASPGTDAAEVRLTRQVFDEPTPETATWGALEGSLDAVSARLFDLPDGPKRVILVLGDDIAAVFSNQEGPAGVHWRDGEPFQEQLETSASRLLLLHLGQGAAGFGVELFPIASVYMEPPLEFGAPYERREPARGTVRLPLAALDTERVQRATLHLGGAAVRATVVTPDGEVVRGRDIPVPVSGGMVSLEHDPGLVLAWIDAPGLETEGIWGTAAAEAARSAPPTTLALPATITLQGDLQKLRVAPDQAMVLHVRSRASQVALVVFEQAPPEVLVLPDGGEMDVYLAGAPVTLVFRPIGDASLWGEVQLLSTPVTPTGEGLGPSILLGAGGTRYFSFQVTDPGTIGVGVRAERDVVSCKLLDRHGRLLGEGVVQQHRLEPDTYLLALHLPENMPPVRARPAVVGVARPSSTPRDVIERYAFEPGETSPRLSSGAPEFRWAARWLNK